MSFRINPTHLNRVHLRRTHWIWAACITSYIYQLFSRNLLVTSWAIATSPRVGLTLANVSGSPICSTVRTYLRLFRSQSIHDPSLDDEATMKNSGQTSTCNTMSLWPIKSSRWTALIEGVTRNRNTPIRPELWPIKSSGRLVEQQTNDTCMKQTNKSEWTIVEKNKHKI